MTIDVVSEAATLPQDGLTLADFMPKTPAASSAKRPQPMRKPPWFDTQPGTKQRSIEKHFRSLRILKSVV